MSEEIFNKQKDIFNQFSPLDRDEWLLFKARAKIHHYKKGEIIHHAGDICSQLYFINIGIIRSYTLDSEGKDYTWGISFNDENSAINNVYLTDYDSFLNKTKSRVSFEVLEDCQLLSISYDDLQFLYQSSKTGERFGRLMAEQLYSYAYNLILDRLTKPASTRYKEFVENTPYLLDKVPQYHIATFLGITPQSLSRIRQKLQASGEK